MKKLFVTLILTLLFSQASADFTVTGFVSPAKISVPTIQIDKKITLWSCVDAKDPYLVEKFKLFFWRCSNR